MRVAMPRNCLNVTKISVPFGSGARQPDLYSLEWDHRAKSRRDPLFRKRSIPPRSLAANVG